MNRACKVCDTDDSPASGWAPDVCEDCLRYDWGHWRWRGLNWLGAAAGAAAAWGAFVSGGAGAALVYPLVVAGLAVLLGAVLGIVFTTLVADRVLHLLIVRSAPSEAPEERAREAEKFFYISLLSAYQGKVRFALDMLEQARRHGWAQWERLTADPRLDAFARLDRVRRITAE